jgi:23S rRNA (guanosine2251-2'-O)-methyltransferase
MTTEHIYGWHAVLARLRQPESGMIRVLLAAGKPGPRAKELLAIAKSAGVRVDTIARRELDALAPDASHQGVVAECRGTVHTMPRELPDLLAAISGPPLILVLDGVQDPHNLGACLRTADAAGVQGVIVPKDNSAPLTPVVRKVASGAAELMPLLRVTNLARTLDELREHGIRIVGADADGETEIYQAQLAGPLAVVLGAEGGGLRRLTREHCDELVRIPLVGTVSSLNVSVATGICLFEAFRQRAVTCRSADAPQKR